MRKGQISIAIILGVILLLVVGIGLYAYSRFTQSRIETEAQLESRLFDGSELQEVVTRCIEQTTMRGLSLIGRQGGRLAVPSELVFENTSFSFIDGINVQPLLNESRTDLQIYIDKHLQDCTNFTEFEKKGFMIKAEEPTSSVFFGLNDVIVDVHYPLSVSTDNFRKDFSSFRADVPVRYRRLHEVALRVVNAQLAPEFKMDRPLLSVDKGGFEVSFRSYNDTIAYTIKDNFDGYVALFIFAIRLRPPIFSRVVELQKNSQFVASTLPFVIYSPDRMAHLTVDSGSIMFRYGKSVPLIFTSQSYPAQVTQELVPFTETAENSIERGNLTWNLSNPVYEFSPSGLKFNKNEILRIYSKDTITVGDAGILYYNGSDWRPLPVIINYTDQYVQTQIRGFSKYTLVRCKNQPIKTVSAMAELDPGETCTFKQAIYTLVSSALVFLFVIPPPYIFFLFVEVKALLLGSVIGFTAAAQESYDSAPDSITFTPTCDQYITFYEDNDGAVGSCQPKGTIRTKNEDFTIKTRGEKKKERLEALPAGAGGEASEHVVQMLGAGFDPASLTINKGDTVVFLNKDINLHWPASNPHPAHSGYPEAGGCTSSTFDACRSVGAAEQFSFTFTKAGTWSYHDHLNPRFTGKIVVQDTMNTTKNTTKTVQPKVKNLASAGEPITINAKVNTCNGWRKYVCGRCAVTCSASYR